MKYRRFVSATFDLMTYQYGYKEEPETPEKDPSNINVYVDDGEMTL